MIGERIPQDQRKAQAKRAYGEDFVRPYMRETMAKEGSVRINEWYQKRLKLLPEMVVEASEVPQFGWERAFSVKDVGFETLPEKIRQEVLGQEEVGVVTYTEENSRRIRHTLFVAYDKAGEKVIKETETTGDRGGAFNVNGVLVKKYQLNTDGERQKDENGNDILIQEWWQPIVDQSVELVRVWTPDGIKEVAVSGFVGIIRDNQGRIAVALEQEPGAHSDKYGLIRTPVQTSVAKLNKIAAGEFPADPLTNVIKSIVPEGKTFEDLLLEPGVMVTPEATVDEIRPEPLPYADANRMDSRNLAIEFPPMSDEIINELTADGKIFMATPQEVFALHRARLLNYHAAGLVLDLAIKMLRKKE